MLNPLLQLNSHRPSAQASVFEWNQFEQNRALAIAEIGQTMARARFFHDTYPQWTKELKAYKQRANKGGFENELDLERMEWARQQAYVHLAFQRLTNTNIPSVLKLIKLSTPKIRPVNIIFWSRSQKAGVHRNSHHVGINPKLVGDGEDLFLLVHELAHRAMKSLAQDESDFAILARAIEELQNSNPATLIDRPPHLLNHYVEAYADLGLRLQFLNEWRAWTASFDIYLKIAEQNKDLKFKPPWGKIPWVEQILSQRMPEEELKKFTFRYLDGRFNDPQVSEIPYLGEILALQRNALRDKVKKGELSLNELEAVLNL